MGLDVALQESGIRSFFIEFPVSAKIMQNKNKHMDLLPMMWYTNHSKRGFWNHDNKRLTECAFW